MTRLHRPAAAALAAALLALTGCAGDSSEPAAAPSSSKAGSSRDADTSTSQKQVAEGERVATGDFVDDMKSGLQQSTTARMSMDVDAGGAGLQARGQIDYTTKPVSMAMTMENSMMGSQQMQLRLVDGVMYVNMGQMSNGKFVSYDLSDTANLPPGMQGLQQQMDPLASFDGFEQALKSVTYEGTENVRGDELSRYRAVLDTAKAGSLQGVPAQPGMPKQLSYDLWFDEQFRARRMTTTIDGPTPVTMDVELSEWDRPVDIQAPPRGEVVDGTTLSG